MAKKQVEVTAGMLRKAYMDTLVAMRKPDAEAIVDFTEKELAEFIRRYVDANFKGVYAEQDHKYYDDIKRLIPINQEMKDANEAAELKFSIYLNLYAMFLQSKQYMQLFKRRIAGAKEKVKPASKFREETEGERKHVAKETDVIYRNPALRQHCLDKYGYQCQCCGMDFAEMYGEVLGANFIEVHHLKPISTFETDGVPENFLENLVPLCSNCHSMIHHVKDSEHTLRDLREAYRGEKKELKMRKDD